MVSRHCWRAALDKQRSRSLAAARAAHRGPRSWPTHSGAGWIGAAAPRWALRSARLGWDDWRARTGACSCGLPPAPITDTPCGAWRLPRRAGSLLPAAPPAPAPRNIARRSPPLPFLYPRAPAFGRPSPPPHATGPSFANIWCSGGMRAPALPWRPAADLRAPAPISPPLSDRGGPSNPLNQSLPSWPGARLLAGPIRGWFRPAICWSRPAPSCCPGRSPARQSRGSRSACCRPAGCRASGRPRVVMAQITSFQSRMLTSSSTTTMNLVYMNWRRKLQMPNITRRAWPG